MTEMGWFLVVLFQINILSHLIQDIYLGNFL